MRQAPGWQLTVSVGTASWALGHPATKAVQLLAQADAALDAAKHAGKDQAVSSTVSAT